MAFRPNARRAILARFYKSTSATPPLYHTQAAYSEIEKACREQWDGILASYEDLRRYCVSDSASASTATLMAEDIKTALQKVSGPMEKDQKVRFENELSAYRR